MSVRSRTLVAALALCGVGCAQIPYTQLDLSLEARPAEFAARVDGFEVRVWGGRYETLLTPVRPPAGLELTLPAIVPLIPADDDASRTFTAEAELFEGATSLGTQRVIGRFVQNERRVLSLVFRPECAAVSCGPEERCTEGGVCEPACFEQRGAETVPVPCPETLGGPCVVCEGDLCRPRPASDGCFDGVRLGDGHGCASSAGQLFCWGSNTVGQLGIGAGRTAFAPERVTAPGGGAWGIFEAGGDATCGVVDDALYCWGAVPTAAGPPGSAATPEPVDFMPAEGWSQLSLSSGWLCGLHAGGASCRGSAERMEPVDLGFEARFIDTSHLTACALDAAGRFRCWGRSNEGQAGDGMLVGGRMVPPENSPEPDIEFLSVAVSAQHACGVTTAGFLLCWGVNLEGQLGVDGPWFSGCDSRRCFPSPEQVPMLGWAAVTVGARHTCAIRAEGQLYCWGDNRMGQLGVETSTPSATTPTRVPAPDGSVWAEVVAAAEQTCALTRASALYCWGNNAGGRLGFAPTRVDEIVTTPRRVTR